MEDKVSILHISDLHIGQTDGLLKKDKYIEGFKEALSSCQKKRGEIKKILLTGDIIDVSGNMNENYSEAKKIIEDIKEYLELENKDILIVPGNHDLMDVSDNIGRISKEDALKNTYGSYREFYKKILGRDEVIPMQPFEVEVWEEEKIVFIRINSNNNDIKNPIKTSTGSPDRSTGWIDDIELKKFIKTNLKKYQNYIKIAIMHHSVAPYKEEKITDLTIGNAEKIRNILIEGDIKIVLCGHMHGGQCIEINKLFNIVVGSLGVNFSHSNETDRHNAFNIIEKIEGGLTNYEYKLLSDEKKDRWIEWDKKTLIEGMNNTFTDDIGMLGEDDEDTENTDESKRRESNKLDIEKDILKIIQQNGLYKTGHFHWEGKKTLGWIDASYILEAEHYHAKVGIESVIDEIIDTIPENTEVVVIGSGIKGNIMASLIRYNYPEFFYTYYPEKAIDHIELEKQLNLAEVGNKHFIVMVDVVFSGESAKEIFKQVEKYITIQDRKFNFEIICIVYSGSEDKEEKLVKLKWKMPTGKQGIINIHSMCSIPIKQCNLKHKCSIQENNLDIVYEFREEEEWRK